jgi:glycosyltransferase involved in cell wall biosynthesis
MRILIVEPECEGHHIVLYVKELLRKIAKYKNITNVTLLTSKKTLKYPLIKELKKEIKYLKVYTDFNLNYPKNNKNVFSLLFFQINNFFILKEIYNKKFKKNNFDYIFINTLDYLEKAISIFGTPFKETPFSGIFLNPKIHLKKNLLFYLYYYLLKRLFRIKELKSIFSNDKFFVEFCKKKLINYNHKVSYFAEPVSPLLGPNRTYSRNFFGFKKKHFVILVYGALKNSKSIQELLLTFNIIKNNNIKVIIAGQQTSYVKKIMAQDYVKKLIINKIVFISQGFHSNFKENLIFNASNLVWLAYKDGSYGSSGVLFKAASSKLPVITTKEGLTGWQNKKYQFGITINLNNYENISNKILDISSNKLKYKKFSNNIFRFFREQQKFNFANVILDKII